MKRRRKGKTDYKARRGLLKSGKNRIVFRKTNKYIIGQLIKSKEARDKVIVGITSKELLKYGWPENAKGSLKSLPASYLTGYLLGKKSKGEEVVFDFGMIRNVYKSRAYGFLKGLIDSGIEIKSDKKVFPEKDRIEGKHLKNKIDFNKIKNKIENE